MIRKIILHILLVIAVAGGITAALQYHQRETAYELIIRGDQETIAGADVLLSADARCQWKISDEKIADLKPEEEGKSCSVETKKSGTIKVSAKSKNHASFKYVTIKKMDRDKAIFIGHQGFSSKAPGDSLAAIDLACNSDFHGVEVDVRQSAAEKKKEIRIVEENGRKEETEIRSVTDEEKKKAIKERKEQAKKEEKTYKENKKKLETAIKNAKKKKDKKAQTKAEKKLKKLEQEQKKKARRKITYKYKPDDATRQLYIHHDNSLKSTTGKDILINKTKPSKLKNIIITQGANIKKYPNEHVPTFGEYVSVVRKYPDIDPFVEVKGRKLKKEMAGQMIDALSEADLVSHTYFLGFHEESLERIRGAARERGVSIHMILLAEFPTQERINKARDLNCEGLICAKENADEKAIARIEKAKIAPGVYTVDDPREAYQLVYVKGIRYCVSNMKLFE